MLFAPLDYFVKVNVGWRNDPSFRVESFDRIIVSGYSLNVFWSNKYMPFTEFIIADKSYGEWIAKPSINKRLYVKISDNEQPDKMDLRMYTKFKFKIMEPEKITILHVSARI